MAALEQRLRAGVTMLSRHWYVVIALLVLAVSLPTLGERPFRFEEGRRVVQALAIEDGGSWWTLETFGEHYVNKPPGMPWLLVASAQVFGGYHEFAMRIPAVLAVLGGALTAGFLAFRLAGEERRIAALAAAAAFISSNGIFMTLRLAETDGPAIFFTALAFTIWAGTRLANRLGIAAWAAITASLAAAIFIKGPPPVAFALLPMAVVPLRQRRWGEFCALVICTAIAAAPTLVWVSLNADPTTAGHLAREMRLTSGNWFEQLRAVPAVFVNGLAQALPALAFGAIAIWRGRLWRWQQDRWAEHALFLFAVPVFVAILLWPGSVGRYGLPAIWPFAVLSGLLVARLWRRWFSPALLAAMLAAFFGIQATYAALEGRTQVQRQQRAVADALGDAFASLPAGKVAILSEGLDYNRYVQIGRNADFIGPSELACTTTPYLLSEEALAGNVDPAVWDELGRIGGADAVLFQRRPNLPGC
jgi:4-amino-4-deoxy-L-arabinose transferase-like glycosyltransferase